MNSKRRSIIWILALVSLLVGGVVSTSAQEPVTLKFMFWGGPEAPSDWDRVVSRFQAAGHENVTVEYIHQPDEYETKLNTLIAAGDAPDVVLMNGPMVTAYGADGSILDQTPFYEAAGEAPEDIFVEAAIRRINGEVSCVASGVHSMMMYYNKRLFDESGVAYPPHEQDQAWTWDEFADAARQMTTGEGISKRYGAYIPPWPTIWRVFVESNGGSYYNDDFTAINLDQPEAVEVFQNLADLRLVDGSVPRLDVIDSLGWDIFLQTDRAAMFIDGTFDMTYMKEWWGDDLALAVLPRYDKYVTHPIIDCATISKTTEHPQEAFDLVRFMAEPTNWLDDYQSGRITPSAREYLFGDKLSEWIDSPDLPENYQSVVVNNLNYAGTNPEFLTPKHSSVEWPAIMPHVFDILNGEVTAAEGMAAAKAEADVILQEP